MNLLNTWRRVWNIKGVIWEKKDKDVIKEKH